MEGDWLCANCGDHQFARNSACRMCRAPRAALPNPAAPAPAAMRSRAAVKRAREDDDAFLAGGEGGHAGGRPAPLSLRGRGEVGAGAAAGSLGSASPGVVVDVAPLLRRLCDLSPAELEAATRDPALHDELRRTLTDAPAPPSPPKDPRHRAGAGAAAAGAAGVASGALPEPGSRLFAVIDLDMTLVHSTYDARAGALLDASMKIAGVVTPEEVGVHVLRTTQPSSDGSEEVDVHVKIRPGMAEFLERMHRKYVLFLYTQGSLAYAQLVLSVIDPGARFFGTRVIARDSLVHREAAVAIGRGAELVGPRLSPDGLSTQHMVLAYAKTVNAVFRCASAHGLTGGHTSQAEAHGVPPVANEEEFEDALVIVDDRDDLWCFDTGGAMYTTGIDSRLYTRPSVYKVPAYSFWHNLQAASPAAHSAAPPDDVSTTADDQLFKVAAVLEEAHAAWMTAPPGAGDLRQTLRRQREKVLAGCNVVFSTVIPLGVRPVDDWHWRVAEAYGARCFDAVVPGTTTHLVAKQAGSLKCRAALQAGMKIVLLDWLYESVTRWERQDEAQFRLPLMRPSGPPMAGEAAVRAPVACGPSEGGEAGAKVEGARGGVVEVSPAAV